MSDVRQPLSRDSLIQSELAGKSTAVARYDEMLWKIRTGYVGVLYGSLTLIASLGDLEGWSLPLAQTALAAILLITGFTVCGLTLDFSFLTAKLRVVQARDALMDLALEISTRGNLDPQKEPELQVLLHNSGETRRKVVWTGRARRWPLLLLYLFTWLSGCLAIGVLII